MAAVSPFRGWRYDLDTVGDMASVLCPPYDMINAETQEALKRQNQYNVIHLEAGEGRRCSCDILGACSGTDKDSR